MSPDPETPEVKALPAASVPEPGAEIREKSPAEQAEQVDDSESTDDSPPLPFSKARCIAVVATTTGASFMNVRLTFPSTLPPFPHL